MRRVIGLTQREAYGLEARVRSQATLANTLFGVAGGLAVVGGIFWVLGGDVAVAPAGAGAQVSGSF